MFEKDGKEEFYTLQDENIVKANVVGEEKIDIKVKEETVLAIRNEKNGFWKKIRKSLKSLKKEENLENKDEDISLLNENRQDFLKRLKYNKIISNNQMLNSNIETKDSKEKNIKER